MLELAIAGSPGFAVERAGSSVRARRTGGHPEALRAREPEAAFTLLLGADAASELDACTARTTCGAGPIVFSRPAPIPSSSLIAASVKVPAVDIGHDPASSPGREPIRYWVPDAVADMVRHRLYLDPE
jgi:hypothetical protein